MEGGGQVSCLDLPGENDSMPCVKIDRLLDLQR